MRRPGSTPLVCRLAAAALVLAASGCGQSGPKPSDADIAAYLAQTQPQYLHLGQVTSSFEAASGGTSKLPEGSWRIHVSFVLRAQQDLFAPVPDTRARRASFDLAVAKVERFRVARIAGVEQLARRAGLMPDGASAPEPAVSVQIATRKDQARPDAVTLVATPDGKEWKFFQADAQTLDDETIGAPLEALKASSPHTVFVGENSPEERDFRSREARFLDVLAKVPNP